MIPPDDPLERIDGVIRAVFRPAVRRPALLGLVREVSRLPAAHADRLRHHVQPMVDRCLEYLSLEMDKGRLRRADPGMIAALAYATVTGMQVARAGAAITALPNGEALIAGGFQLELDIANGAFVAEATETADLFSQAPNALTPTGSMAEARAFPIAVPLPDGTVMVLGGGPLSSEIYQR